MKITALVLSAILAVTGSAALAADHFHDAMALSIEHFNGDHDKDIKSWGPEHRFMYELLNAVDETVPAVSGITRLGKIPYNHDDPFRFLKKDVYFAL